MLAKTALSSVNLNALAKMVSNAGLQRIIFDDNYKKYGRQMKNLLNKSGGTVAEKLTFKDIIDASYAHLLTHYRHEYLYKTALLNSYVLKHYSLADTILLNEFKIGNSKADAVLVNGTNKVFEIKTELDSPERLQSQLNDYYKAFSEVYLVVHHSAISKYLQLVDEHVGVMTFNHNCIEVYRESSPNYSGLDITTMVKSLRKEEYLAVVKKITGNIPQVPPVLLFRTCLDILTRYNVDEVQYEFLKAIKRRINPSLNELVLDSELPDSLRLSCYHSNLDQNTYIGLIKRLNFQI